MSNSIFDWPASLKRFVRFTSAKAEEVNDALDDLSAGLDTVEANIARAVKLPIGTADQTLALAAGQRAGLLLGFDPSGNVAGIAGGGRWRGDWATATLYAIADYFRDPVSKSIYVCLEQHTSTSIATDLAANKVRLAIDVAEVENQRILAQQAATAANGSYLLAANQASLAANQAVIAGNKATDADIARAAAVVAQNAAQDAFDSFDGRYLGQKPTNPVTDNDGGALVVGALYFRTTAPIGMKVWTGAAWDDAYANLSSKFDKTGGDVDGNINFTGTGRRITGDFSNATVAADRVFFQTSVANDLTAVGAIPNGTSRQARLGVWNTSTPGTSAALDMAITDTEARLRSFALGGASFVPMTTYVGGFKNTEQPVAGGLLVTGGALGYGAGAGGTVVQATNKSTAVTLNKICGKITMHNEALAANAAVRFAVNNTFVDLTDEVSVWLANPVNPSAYDVAVDGLGSGVFVIRLRNNTSTSYSDSVVIGFAVRKGSTS